ncbi:GntR family transcriptional regulator [Salipiger sp.]|uniref:GntR family transcriptional regulator n=1 Tax=Salipiger sp. TaxID=2078585 RepID=UPI003A96B04D
MSLAQIAYEALRAKICDGVFGMGDKVSEAVVSELTGMSRTPVRAALSRLEGEGFLIHEPNVGFRVKVFTVEEVREIYGVRALLESEAVRLAGRRGLSDPVKTRLCALRDAMAGIVAHETGSNAERLVFQRHNYDFHNLIYDQCGNRFLRNRIDAAMELPLALRNFFNFSPEELAKSHEAHVSILASLVDGDAERAAAHMREHIWAARDRMAVRKTRTRRQGGRRPEVSSRGKRILTPGRQVAGEEARAT